MLVPHLITALEESNDPNVNTLNTVSGAVVSLFDLQGQAVLLYDDESGSNPSTTKTTDSSGQVVVWVTPGEYNQSVQGGTLRRITVSGNDAIEVDTFSNLQLLRPTNTGQAFICQERANSKYILQNNSYTALVGDVTFANGRVAALQLGAPLIAENFGVPTDSTDDTQIIVDACSRLTVTGGEVQVRGKYLIDSDLTIPARVSLIGVHDYLDSTDRDSWPNLDGRLRLNSANTINLGNGSGLSKLVIYRSGMTFPPAGLTAADVALYAGNAITVNSAAPYIYNNVILGFDWAIVTDSANTPRGQVIGNKIDCTNGVDIDMDLGAWNIDKTRCEPILTNSDADNIRTGIGFRLRNRSDWSFVTDCFAFQDTGFKVDDANHIKFTGCGADHPTDGTDLYNTGIGFDVDGDSLDNIFLACQSASHQKGFKFSSSSGDRNYMIGCGVWNLSSTGIGIEIASGDLSVLGGYIRDFVGSTGKGILVNNASSKVNASGGLFMQNISVGVDTPNFDSFLDDGTLEFTNVATARANESIKQIASTGTLTLPSNQKIVEVTGTTTIGTIVGAGVMPYDTVTLIFTDGLTLNNGNTLLDGATNWSAPANSSIKLQYITANTWREVSRNSQ